MSVALRSISAVDSISIFGASSAQMSHSPSQAAALIGAVMPEAHQGKNLARAVALVSGPDEDKLQESLKSWFTYFPITCAIDMTTKQTRYTDNP